MAAYLIPATTALIALTLALLVYVVKVAKKRAIVEAKPAAVNEMALRRRISSLGAAFRNSVSLIELNLASRWRRYQIPWVLLLGESGSGKSVLIENSGIDRAFRTSSGAAVQHAAVGWHYFNRGVVLDVAGEYLGATASAGAGDRAWQALLRLTEKYRPKRPIDAVVITVSAAALTGTDALAAEDAARQADLLHRRLWQAQSRFGIVFPVYVVVTQCDRLQGFASFVRALPVSMRGNILGWSNPYDFESGYKSAMADQALDGVVHSAFELEAEIFAAGRPVPDADALVQFPASIGALRNGLRTYLDQLFRPSAYHETFFFRGVYLAGDAGFSPPAVAPSLGTPASSVPAMPLVVPRDDLAAPGFETRRDPVFVRDIFEAKVFPEFGMARPSRDSLMSKNRTVRILRWVTVTLAVIWSCTLILAAFQLDAKVDAYENALDLMVKVRKERQAAHERKENLPPDWYIQNTTLLLDKMAPLGGVRLWWFSIPGSWPGFTEIHDEIQKTLYGGFQDIVFNTVRKGLNVKISDLTGIPRNPVTTELRDTSSCTGEVPPATQGGAAPTSLLIDDLPEFAQLREYVRGATELHNSLTTFERLKRGEAGIPDLRGLLRYTWNIALPESLDNSAYHTAAMRQGYKFDYYDPSVVFVISSVCSFNQRVDQTFAKFFTENPAIALTRDIAKALTKSGDAQSEASLAVETYADLLTKIQALDSLVKSGRAAWLQAGERELGTGYSDLMLKVAEVSVLGTKARDESRAKAQAQIEALNRELAQVSAESVGTILRKATDRARWELSPDVATLQASLGALLKQRFMTGVVEGRSLDTRVGPLTPVRWDLKRLDDAIALADEQRRYMKDGIGKFPPMLQSEIQELANWQLSRRVTDLLASAQIIQHDTTGRGDRAADAAADMQDFDRAGPRLVNLLTKLKDMGAEPTYNDLSALLKRDALRGLLAIDRSLNGVEAYTGRDGGFSWWQGAKNPALGAFRVSDSQALAEYLGQQYTQIEWLSSLSAPLISVVDSSGMRLDAGAARIVKRWKGINREVEKFKTKNPRSSVAELEAFIRADMAEVDGQNCVEKVGPKLGTARDPDFFQDRLINIRQQLYARCYDLANAEINKAYDLIEDSFRRTLAGKFPFSSRPASAGGIEADAEDIAQFLKIYDRNVKAAMPTQGVRPAAASMMADARKFLEQIDKVKSFMAPVLPTDDNNAAVGYDLSVEFRVNQRSEVDGNKIVDWQIEIGDQVARLRDATRQMRWRPGMPITLTLRWAKDAPTVPVNDGTQPSLSVDGKNVVFRFVDPWALLSVLKAHASGPVDALARSELRPHTLKFEFPTQAASEGGQFRTNAPLNKARVFLRLSVSPNGKKDVLSLPVFPVTAPVIAPEKSGDAASRNGRAG